MSEKSTCAGWIRGADIIVGHHPHVPQNYELVGEKIIFYSLGNLIFDTDYQRQQSHTDRGLLLKLKLSENGYSWEARPYRIDREQQRIVPGELPAIFRPISPEEYQNLIPLAAHRFWQHYKKGQIFLKPQRAPWNESEWDAYYLKNRSIHALKLIRTAMERLPDVTFENIDPALIDYLNE